MVIINLPVFISIPHRQLFSSSSLEAHFDHQLKWIYEDADAIPLNTFPP
jgi:hypothetical protein